MRRVLAIGLLFFSTAYYQGNALATNTPQFLSVSTASPVEFILTDPQGRRKGYDPVTNTTFDEILANYSTTLLCDEATFSFCSPPYKRLEMGNEMTGQYTLDVIGTESGDFRVEVTTTGEAGNRISHFFEGTTARGVASRFTFQGEAIFFASFGAHLKITSASEAFEVNGTFTLGPSGTISPVKQPVTIQLGEDFLVTIPAGSFNRTPQGAFAFRGVIKGLTMCTQTAFNRSTDCLSREIEPNEDFDANLTPTGANGYAFRIVGAGRTNLPSANPVEVHLAIGTNGGTVAVNADFARQHSAGRCNAANPRPVQGGAHLGFYAAELWAAHKLNRYLLSPRSLDPFRKRVLSFLRTIE